MFKFCELEKYSKDLCIIWYKDINSKNIYNYKEVIEASNTINSILFDIFKLDTHTGTGPGNANQLFWPERYVGIIMNHNSVLITSIIGILNADAAFCCINPNNSEKQIYEDIQRFNLLIIIMNEKYSSISNLIKSKYILIKELTILNEIISILHINEINTEVDLYSLEIPINIDESISNSSKICFCTTTSGSTGIPKVIRITYKSIITNVYDLSNLFEIMSNDVVFISSPPTFDPFIIDLFMALLNGATILMVSNKIRLSTNLLPNILFQNNTKNVTVIQMTPSLFKRWNNTEIKEIILIESNSLRLLILGGEEFPSYADVQHWQQWNSSLQQKHKRIFNIYGLTEISCWTTIYEITSADFLNNQPNNIPIGNPIDKDTTLKIIDPETNAEISCGIGELIIENKIRKNFHDTQMNNKLISTEDTPLCIRTNDLIEKLSNGQLVFHTRKNNVQKRFGKLINLTKIEKTAMEMVDILSACCLLSDDRRYIHQSILILFIVGGQKLNLLNYLRQKLLNYEIPDEIIIVNEFPLSNHGKISKYKLLKQFYDEYFINEINSIRRKCTNIIEMFLQKLNNILTINLNINLLNVTEDMSKYKKTDINLSFTSLGGNSTNALYISTFLEYTANQKFPQLITFLLDENVTILEICKWLELNASSHSSEEEVNIIDNNQNVQLIESTYKEPICILWTIDLKKCIDSTPSIFTININGAPSKIISIGNHSKSLVNILIENGKIISKINLPDRIECQVTQCCFTNSNECGIVGCYDGYLYCFEFLTGSIKWKFNSMGMIKSCPIYIEHNNTTIFGNYNDKMNLWCLNCENGNLLWSSKIGEKSIYSNVCLINGDDTMTVIVCTLDGSVCKINIDTGQIVWIHKFNSPIFSTPKYINQLNVIIIAEVIGVVHCMDTNGMELWQYNCNGNIYSSFEIVQKGKEIFIFFGCYNKNLYCLNITPRINYNLLWSFSTQSEIFSTPKYLQYLNLDYIFSCTTNGFVNICHIKDGTLWRQLKLTGDIFSSPVIVNNLIFIGCRNNNLYCLKIE